MDFDVKMFGDGACRRCGLFVVPACTVAVLMLHLKCFEYEDVQEHRRTFLFRNHTSNIIANYRKTR